MSISKDEAAQALIDVHAASGRVRQADAYGRAAPFLIIWGIVWLAADLAWQFAPGFRYAWPVASLTGFAASTVMGFMLPREAVGPGERPAGLRHYVSWLIVVALIFSLFLVMRPSDGRQVHTVFALVFGYIYLIAGVWVGWRVAALGVALVALSFFGFLGLGLWYPLYMGIVGGGALILGGLWLRQI
jgi:hypothetical protein